MKCAVRGCNNKTKAKLNVGFYAIPYNDPELCKKWVEFCGSPKDLNPRTARVCGDHFQAKDKERNLQYEMGFQKFKKPKLKPGAVPCIHKQEESEAKGRKNDLLSFPTVMLNEGSETSEQMLSEAEKEDPGKDPLDEEEEKRKFNIKYVTLKGKQVIGPAPVTLPSKPPNKGTEIPQPQQNLINKPNINKAVPPPPKNFKGILAVLYPVDETGKAVHGLLGNNFNKQGLNVNPTPNPKKKTIPYEDHIRIRKLKEENELLKKTEKRQKEQIRKLEIELIRSQFVKKDLEKKLRALFSNTQIRKLKTGRRVIWSEKDMAQAVKLYQTSPAAYRLLKGQKYPLPSIKSVQTWIQMCRQQLKEMDNSKEIDEQIDDIIEECESECDEPEQQDSESQNSIKGAVKEDHDYSLVVD